MGDSTHFYNIIQIEIKFNQDISNRNFIECSQKTCYYIARITDQRGNQLPARNP